MLANVPLAVAGGQDGSSGCGRWPACAQGSRSSLGRRVVWPEVTENKSLWRTELAPASNSFALNWTSRAVAKSEA